MLLIPPTLLMTLGLWTGAAAVVLAGVDLGGGVSDNFKVDRAVEAAAAEMDIFDFPSILIFEGSLTIRMEAKKFVNDPTQR
jgi:hypothetical protein